MKKTLVTLALSCALCAPASAQIPTTDVILNGSTLMQHVATMKQWAQQFQEMGKQFDQAKAHLQALSGARGLANLFNNPDIQALLPEEFNDVVSFAQSLPNFARERAKYKTFADRPAANKLFDTVAAHAAMASDLYGKAQKRLGQVNKLRQQIDLANDPAEKADLANRLISEGNAMQSEIALFERMKQNEAYELDQVNRAAQQEVVCAEFKRSNCQ